MLLTLFIYSYCGSILSLLTGVCYHFLLVTKGFCLKEGFLLKTWLSESPTKFLAALAKSDDPLLFVCPLSAYIFFLSIEASFSTLFSCEYEFNFVIFTCKVYLLSCGSFFFSLDSLLFCFLYALNDCRIY